MRILFVSSAYYPYPSGVSEHVHNLAIGLENLGHNITILTTNFPNTDSKPKFQPHDKIYRLGKAILIPLNQSYATFPFSFNLPFAVRSYLKRERFDIIHLYGIFPPEISFWALHYSKTINIVTFLTAGFRHYNFGTSLLQNLSRKYLNKLSGKIAISKVAQKTVEQYVPGNYWIIPSGVDTARFNPQVSSISGLLGRKILFVGRFDKRKGLPVLIQAFAEIKNEIQDSKLLIIGAGPLENYCKHLTEKLNTPDIIFLGQIGQDTLPRYFSSCDVFCSPALGGEALGIVLLEAMASGKPVVASNISGYNEVIVKPEQGILVPINNPKILAQELIRILKNENLRNKLSKAGLARAQEFSWQKISKRTEEFYYQILVNKR